MWLINTSTLQLEEFPDEWAVKYAILSHRWEEDEVLFRDMNAGDSNDFASKKGYRKLKDCCEVVASLNLNYVWIDTCCIDKQSSAELQEAINSMFRWYQHATVCIAYLSDYRCLSLPLLPRQLEELEQREELEQLEELEKHEIFEKLEINIRPGFSDMHDLFWQIEGSTKTPELTELDQNEQSPLTSMLATTREKHDMLALDVPRRDYQSHLERCEWFKRGWTLQELLAPRELFFYNCYWSMIGSRQDGSFSISEITGIPVRFLKDGFEANGETPVAQIMSWAKGRKTTRLEDQAYSLLGLFNVNMPMLYGEGRKAFQRLQQEILKNSGDQSVFAWERWTNYDGPGLLADSPEKFPNLGDIRLTRPFERRKPSTFDSQGIVLEVALAQVAVNTYLAVLNYQFKGFKGDPFSPRHQGVCLRALDANGRFARVSDVHGALWIGKWPMRSRIKTVTVVHNLKENEDARFLKDYFKVSVSPWIGGSHGRVRARALDPLQEPIFFPSYLKWEKTWNGCIGSFYLEGGFPAHGLLHGLILGIDFNFNMICIMRYGSNFENEAADLEIHDVLKENTIWKPFEEKWPMMRHYQPSGTSIETTDSEEGSLVLRGSNFVKNAGWVNVSLELQEKSGSMRKEHLWVHFSAQSLEITTDEGSERLPFI